QAGARSLMEALGLRFGRLDFVLDKEGTLWFLEVNPNGQFAWLDTDGSDGMLTAVAKAVRRVGVHPSQRADAQP
ncbi:MAG: hypothetical protein KC492_20215, partial [Myxococcales bacterium]|nr:hypothetical protein [Myxococcales bacterium]